MSWIPIQNNGVGPTGPTGPSGGGPGYGGVKSVNDATGDVVLVAGSWVDFNTIGSDIFVGNLGVLSLNDIG